MIPLVVLAAVAIFVYGMLKAGGWAAANPSIVALCICALAYVALHFWHKRRIAEIQDREISLSPQYKRVNRFLPWPRECLNCGIHLHDFWAVKHHDNPKTSPCAAMLAQREADEAGVDAAAGQLEPAADVEHAPATFTATVLRAPSGAVDTFTDDPQAIGAGDAE